MTRNDVQTVTFPVIVLADSIDDSDGWGTFLPGEQFDENDDKSLLVHLVTKEDARKWTRTAFKQKDADALFRGTGQLKRAYDSRDDFGLHRAYETLRPYVPNLEPPEKFELEFTSRSGKRAKVKFDPRWSAARWDYSRLMTGRFELVKLVVWYSESERRFIPAFFCPDKRTAVYVHLLSGYLRLCPKCDAPFVPKKGNVDYCCAAHREAYRVARARWRAKQRGVPPTKGSPALKR